MILPDPGGRYVLSADLGQDRIYVFTLDRAAGRLVLPEDAPFAPLPTGDGPRHFVFHPNGRWFYSLQEEASTVAFFHFDPATGLLSAQQTLSTLPAGFAGTSFTSEILLSPDGRFLYAANRLHDTIAFFSLYSEGRLHYMSETSTRGDYPRHIEFAPGGSFLYACNQRSDHITFFRVDCKTGLLSFTGRYIPVGSPACIAFLG
jgi:6-phosphogluconolactonase (cycloisomerase 2 family)